MALLDFLKRKEEIEKSKKSERKTDKVSATKIEKKVAKVKEAPKVKTESVSTKASVEGAKFSYEAIKQPHISEKATYLAEKDQYTFEVSADSNKNEIKKAVEGIYSVNVLSVNIIKIPAKKRRLGKTQGFRKAYKKAILKIKEGQKIEIL